MKNLFFSLNSKSSLSLNLSRDLNINWSEICVSKFSDGESFANIFVSVRGSHVFLLNSFSNSINDNIMELLLCVDLFKREGASKVTLISPYLGYSRQDRKTDLCKSLSSRLVSNLLESSGLSEIVLVDVHSDSIQSFFNIPAECLNTSSFIALELLKKGKIHSNLIVVSPDFGGSKRAKKLSDFLNLKMLVMDKNRSIDDHYSDNFIYGNVQGLNCLIADDIVDTGGTLINVIRFLKNKGAADIYLLVTHGLFSENAISKFESLVDSGLLKKIYLTDTINKDFSKYSFVEVISISPFLATVIDKVYIQKTDSIDQIYDDYKTQISKYLKNV